MSGIFRGYGRAIGISLGAAAVCVVLSVSVTTLVLHWTGTGDPPIAYILAALLPAILGPASLLPFGILLERLRRVSTDLDRLARTDALTGLPNRRAFFEAADEILAIPGLPVAAMMIDLDRFKAINDAFGHAGGDRLLVAIAAAVSGAVAATSAERSVVARLGGEEFAVLVVGLAPSAIARLADHVCAAGRRAQTIFNEKTIGSTVSVGVAMLKSGGIDALLKSADDAVYEAKRSGRDRWAFAGDATAAGDPKPARAMGGNHAWSKS